MEINLILTAKSWQLASQLERTKPFGGVQMVKNIPERTYLAVTPKQWQVLARFGDTHTVPQVLESIIADRICPALGEFHELILKAVRARVLVEPRQTVAAIPAANWSLAVKPARLRYVLWPLFLVGLGFTLALRPAVPATVVDVAAGLVATVLAGLLGAGLAASLLRGADGEVYIVRRWIIRTTDACMLSPADQQLVALAPLAIMAAATGFLTWQRPEWSFFPMLGLLVLLRPILKGRISWMIRVQSSQRLSDADHAYAFPPNRTPRVRWRQLRDGLRSPTTWLEIGYGAIWTLLLIYLVGGLTDMSPWQLDFWRSHGPRLGFALIGSLALFGVIYVGSEFYLFAADQALSRRRALKRWYRRWFGRNSLPTDESARLREVLRSPLLRMLPPPEQRAVAKAMKAHRAGAWHLLHESGQPVSHVSLILSGKVGVYRKLPAGRRILIQVLCEDNLVGLHAIADPEHPHFLYRTLTPVLLLQLDWAQAQELVIAKFTATTLANQVQKLPFLARIGLSQNWHIQAIQRCAEISSIVNYKDDDVILAHGFYSDSFFIIFEGEAKITRKGRVQGVIRAGDFFGEIGLLQNSNTTAQVTACAGTRCLCIPRRDFLRFVAHNYTVALELERVSSARLGYPIFPLSPGNFRTL